MSNLKEKVMKHLTEYDRKCGGKCGLYSVQLASDMGVELKVLRTALNELYTDCEIQVRDGAQGKLIMIEHDSKEKVQRSRKSKKFRGVRKGG